MCVRNMFCLTDSLGRYDRITTSVTPVIAELAQPHIKELEVRSASD